MTQTPNYNLKKPAQNEFYNVDDFNDNFDIIDDEIKKANDEIGKKVDSVEGKGFSTNDYTDKEKEKLAGIAKNANKYIHPSSHLASMITQDSTHRFVSDSEKSYWNGKADTSGFSSIFKGSFIFPKDFPYAGITISLPQSCTILRLQGVNCVGVELSEQLSNDDGLRNALSKIVFEETCLTINEVYNLSGFPNGSANRGIRFVFNGSSIKCNFIYRHDESSSWTITNSMNTYYPYYTFNYIGIK